MNKQIKSLKRRYAVAKLISLVGILMAVFGNLFLFGLVGTMDAVVEGAATQDPSAHLVISTAVIAVAGVFVYILAKKWAGLIKNEYLWLTRP